MFKSLLLDDGDGGHRSFHRVDCYPVLQLAPFAIKPFLNILGFLHWAVIDTFMFHIIQ